MKNFLKVKIVSVSLLLLVFTSCNFMRSGIGFTVINTSGEPIENIKIYTTEKLDFTVFVEIPSTEKKTGFLSMKKNETDGAYWVEFTRKNGEVIKSKGGYYTNGRSLNQWMSIHIEKDTVFMKFR
ncbi:MAG: hypothetical protein JKY08_02920 [Flavobacteriaceae bacterium]|nr:hypothetical protein [Flavobacteriaceae bacterium]